jgi:quercetin dioxygenase-like cupin family protein
MSRFGDLFENQVTGEHAVILRGSEDRAPGESAFVHLTVAPHGAVAGEHVHPIIRERFMVISGTLGTRIDGVERELGAGEEATVEPGTRHDWWNSGENEASVLVELDGSDEQAVRFWEMIATVFGLANDGRVDAKGMPSPLQLALLASEFSDVIRFTSPPPALQPVLFAVLGALGRLRGLRGVYPDYLEPHGRVTPDPDVVALAGIAAPSTAV